MSWENLAPVAKTTGSPMVSASLRKNKAGEVTITVFLSSFVFDDIGAPEKVCAQFGRDDNAGMVRLLTASEGAFEFKEGVRGTKRLTLPAFDGVPDNAAASQACRILEKAKGVLVLAMPLTEWRRDIRDRTAAKPPGKPVVSAHLPTIQVAPRGPGGGDKIDVVAYLGGKGVKISRLNGGRFMLDGYRVQIDDVLELVNSYRKRVELPPLSKDQVQ